MSFEFSSVLKYFVIFYFLFLYVCKKKDVLSSVLCLKFLLWKSGKMKMPERQTQEFKEKGKLVSNHAPQITTGTMKTHEIRRLSQTKDAAGPRVDLREQKGTSSCVSLLPSSQSCFIISSLLIVSRNDAQLASRTLKPVVV